MTIKYALHPGHDSDLHWISCTQLAKLYGIKLGECIDVALVHLLSNRMRESLVHLWPKDDGNYKLPEEV